MHAHMIPVEPIAAIIKSWLGEHEPDLRIKDLAELTGIHERTLRCIIHGERKQVTFDTADMLVTRMDRVWLWYTDLAEYYEPPVRPTAAEKRRCGKAQAARVPHAAKPSRAVAPRLSPAP